MYQIVSSAPGDQTRFQTAFQESYYNKPELKTHPVTSKKILIITSSWIGDYIITQPLYRRLHELHPSCTTDAFVPKWSTIVFEHMPEVNRVMENPLGHDVLELKKRWHIGCELGRESYDQVIALPGSLKSAIIVLVTGTKQCTGYIGESRHFSLDGIRKLDKAVLPLMVGRYIALIYPAQAGFNGYSDNPCFTIDLGSHQAALVKHGLTMDKPILVFCPGAEYDLTRRWSARHSTELGHRYLAKGWQVWLLGSQEDFDIAGEINWLSGSPCTNLCGKTNFSEAVDLLSYADTVVCNSSDLMHPAAAFDRELIAVYGSSSLDRTPPLSQKAKIVSLNLGCSPCFKRKCSLGHTDCLDKLTPDIV